MEIEIQANIAEANNNNQIEDQSLLNSQDSIINLSIDQNNPQQEKEEEEEEKSVEEFIISNSLQEIEHNQVSIAEPSEVQTNKINYANLHLMLINEYDTFCRLRYPTIGKLMLSLNSLFLDIIAKLRFDEDIDFEKFKTFKDAIQDTIHDLLSIHLEEISQRANEAYSLSETTSDDLINHKNEMLDKFFSKKVFLQNLVSRDAVSLFSYFNLLCMDLHPTSKFLHLATKMHALIVHTIYAQNAIVANIMLVIYHTIKEFIILFLSDFIKNSLKNKISEKVFGMLYEDVLFASIGHLISTLMSPLELNLTLNQTQLKSNFIREGLVSLALSCKNQQRPSQPSSSSSSSSNDNSDGNSNMSEIIKTEKNILELNGMTQPSKGFWGFFSK